MKGSWKNANYVKGLLKKIMQISLKHDEKNTIFIKRLRKKLNFGKGSLKEMCEFCYRIADKR